MHKQKKKVLCFQFEIRKLADMCFNVDFCFEGIAIQPLGCFVECVAKPPSTVFLHSSDLEHAAEQWFDY